MTAPVLVGLSDPIEDTNFAGYASVTVASGDLASGTASGDRLVALLQIYTTAGGQAVTPPAGWISRGSSHNGSNVMLRVFEIAYDDAALPATFADVGAPTGQSSCSLIVATMRDADLDSTFQGASWANTVTNPPTAWSPASYDIASRGYALAFAYSFNAFTGLSPANGFATEYDGGTLQIAFKAWATGETITPPTWSRPSGGPPYNGAAIFCLWDERIASGLHIGSLRFGSTGPGW